MRILLILDWNRGRGGAEAYATWLRDGLRAAGDEVRLLTSSAGTAGDGTADYVAYGTEAAAAQAFLQIANPMAAGMVRRAVREFRPDVAWVNMFAQHLSPAAVFALGGIPKVLLVSDYKVVCPMGSKLLPDGSLCHDRAGVSCLRSGCLNLPHWLRDQPRYALIAKAVARFDRILSCSKWVQGELARNGIFSSVLPLPIVAPATGFARRPSTQPVFLFCGRLDREKGVDLLLRAFARIRPEFPTATLRIAGQGPRRPALESLAKALGMADAVRFLGWLSRPEIDREMESAWASVAPSVWAEPHGLVAVEAIVRGVPVIVPSIGGLAEIVEPEVSGLWFAPNDERALADCLRRVASGAMPPRLGEGAVRATAQRFSLDGHIREIRRIFAEVSRRNFE